MSSPKEKRFMRQLYPELNAAVSDFLNNPDHKHHPFLYDDLGEYLEADKNNGKFLTVTGYHCFFNGTKKISERIKFTVPLRIAITTNAGLFTLRADAKIERQKNGDFISLVEGYQVDSYVAKPR
jgi:hypothetical protein